jgi:hypothetical protein
VLIPSATAASERTLLQVFLHSDLRLAHIPTVIKGKVGADIFH